MKNCWYRQRHSWPLRTENQTLPKILTARMKQQITKWTKKHQLQLSNDSY